MAMFICAGLSVAAVLRAQAGGRGRAASPITNPREGDTEAIRAGAVIYRARCGSCHGADAKGAVGGGDLSGLWSATDPGLRPDQQLFQSIRRGLPNSLKVHSFGPDTDVWAVLAYLRSLDSATAPAHSPGDAPRGEQIFKAQCSSCHQIDGYGGHLGPDLSQIGAGRSRPALAHKIRHASSYIMAVYSGGFVIEGYQPVTLVTQEGQRIRGVKKNEDAFSIQIMDSNERLQGFLKADLREVVNDDTSLMPDFGSDRLPNRDLEDLLAYLITLRPAPRARPAASPDRP